MPVELSLEDLTPTARAVLDKATQAANQRAMPQIEPAHLLLALLTTKSTLAFEILEKLDVDIQKLIPQVEALLSSEQNVQTSQPSLSATAQQAVRAAFKEATHLGDRRVDALHLLLGLLHSPEGPVYTLLTAAGISLYDLRQQVLQMPRHFRTRYRDSLQATLRPSPVFLGLVALFLASGVMLWFDAVEQLRGPITTVFVLSGWITSVCIHEFGHALAAYYGGDTAVGQAGYLTLNPLRYSHPLLSIVLPVIFLLSGGLGLPGGAVYLRPGVLRGKGWEIFSSAAGPLGTLLFTLLISWPFFGNWGQWMAMQNYHFWTAVSFLAFLQVHVLLFNLLPIPPLDGFQVLAPLLSPALRQQANAFGTLTFFLLLMLFRQDNPVTDAFWRTAFAVADFLHIPLFLLSEGYYQFAWWLTPPF